MLTKSWRFKPIALNLSSFALIAVALVGCGGTERSVDVAARDGIFLIGNEAEPRNLDPHTMLGVPESRIMWALFEGLVTLHPETLEPEPGVAERWEVSEDGLEYTFHLRKDARWSNEEPVTAHDFRYAWKRQLTPTLGGQYAFMLFCLRNAEGYFSGEVKDFHDVGAEALDPHTLRVTLEHPTPYFLPMQVHFTWFPVHRATIEAHGQWDDPTNPWTRSGNMVSNGPFMLKDWQPNRLLTLVRNPAYWDGENVAMRELHFFPTDDVQTLERQFRAGELHISFRVPPAKVAVYQRDAPELLKTSPLFGNYFLRFNVNEPALNDVRVRQALWLAVDRDALCNAVLRAGQQPSTTLVPPGIEGYTSPDSESMDLDKARRLLAEAGFPDGEGFPTLSVLYANLAINRDVAEAVQAMWKDNLGISVQLQAMEWKVYLDTMMGLDFDMATGGWYGDYLDPTTFLEIFESDSGSNWTGWASAEFDDLLQRARREPDPDKRFALLREAEAIVIQEAPFTPLNQYVQVHLIAPHVEGWRSNLMSYINYRYLKLTPPK
jgi:oligopeptide transport system substrate-binding protein